MREQEEENSLAFNREPRVMVKTAQQAWPRRNGFVVVAYTGAIAMIDTKSGGVTYYGHATPSRPAWTSPTMAIATSRRPRFPRVGERWTLFVQHPTQGTTAIDMPAVEAVRFVTMAG